MSIAENVKKINGCIQAAIQTANQLEEQVTLVAVSKQQSPNQILQAVQAGQLHFGENYLQEAVVKIRALSDQPLYWHFIGPIQSNKTHYIAENFSWVHTVSREKIASRLNQQRPLHLPPLNVCVQVNIDQSTTKSGLPSDEVAAFLSCFASYPQLRLRGLMVMPDVLPTYDEQFAICSTARRLFDMLRQQGFELDTLSMGMSKDLKAAIAAGSNMVRVGQAIFGARQYNEGDKQ